MSGSLQEALRPVSFVIPSQQGATGATGSTGTTLSVPQQIVQGFTQAGYPQVVAEGIARRAGFEGGSDPAKLGDSYTSLGLFQEHGPRMQGLLNYSQQTRQNPLDTRTQIRYAQQEIERDPALKARLMNAKTPEEAYDIFTRGFERPADPLDHGPGGLNISQPSSGTTNYLARTGSAEGNIFRDMLAKQSGDMAIASEHLQLARSAELQMQESAPKPVPTPLAQQWGSLAMAVAALGGLLTHTPATTAFNAMAGVLNAFQKRDMDAAKEQFEHWQAAHKALMDTANLQLKEAELAIKSAGNEPKGMQAALAAVTAASKNEYANYLANHGDTAGALAVLAGFKDRTIVLGEAGNDIQKRIEKSIYEEELAKPGATEASAGQATLERMAGAKKTPAPGSPGAERQALHDEYRDSHPDVPESEIWKLVERDLSLAKSGASPESIHNTAKMIASYQEAPLSSFAMSRGLGAQIMGEVKEINPDYQASRFAEVNRAMTAFGAGKQGDTVRYLNVAVQHLDVLEKAVEALHNGDVRLINEAFQRAAAATGEAAPVTFDGLKHIIGTEIQKAVAGGIGAIADRDRLLEALNRANSPEQLIGPNGVIEGFKALMAGQAQGLKKEYEDSTGFTSGPFAFDTKLLPATKRQLNLLQGDTGPAVPRVGEVHDGYRFKGGNPADKNSWEPVQ